MNVIAFVFLLAAAIVFVIDWGGRRPRRGVEGAWWSMIGLGLCLLTIGLIIQFGAKTHTLLF